MLTRKPPPLAASRPRLSWPSRIVYAGAGMLLIAVVFAAYYIATYQPLARGVMGWQGLCVESVDALVPEPYHRFEVASLACDEDGDVVSWGYSLRNDGPLPIRLKHLDPVGPAAYPLGPIELRAFDTSRTFIRPAIDDPDDVPSPAEFDSMEPFSAVVLEPGDEWFFVFRSLLRGPCRGGGARYGPSVIRFEVLGISREETFYPPVQLAVCT